MEQRILKLKNQVAALVEWRDKQLAKQVDFPLGFGSASIVRKNLLVFTGETGVPISADIWLEVERDGELFWLAAQQI